DADLQPQDTFSIPRYEGETFSLTSPGRQMVMIMGVPFSPALRWRLSPRGEIWLGITDRYRLHRLNFAGDTLRIIERMSEPVPVTALDRATALEGLTGFIQQGGTVDERRIPNVKPAFRVFSVDTEGYLWVRPTAAAAEED